MKKFISKFLLEIISLICVLLTIIYIYSIRDVKVSRVIDGDTFITNRGDRVRLIGIDAPEMQTLRGLESKMHLDNLINNEVVILKRDEISNNKDKYGRLLRYVYMSDKDINLQMLKDGYAKPYLYFNFQKLNQYRTYD